MTRRVLSWERYRRIQMWSADYARALVRTNLAVRCWLRRFGDRLAPERLAAAVRSLDQPAGARRGGLPRGNEDDQPEVGAVLTWLVGNHIRQAFYQSYGIDVVPLDPANPGGPGWVVQTAAGCKGDPPQRLAIISPALRVVRDGAEGPGLDVGGPLGRGEDPLWVIDTAAIFAVGGRWPWHCHRRRCPHRSDAEVYLTVSQIVTLLLCMGAAAHAQLAPAAAVSAEAEAALTSVQAMSAAHCATEAPAGAFAVRWDHAETDRWDLWVDRHTGQLTKSGGDVLPFADWCGGDVDRGLRFLWEWHGGKP